MNISRREEIMLNLPLLHIEKQKLSDLATKAQGRVDNVDSTFSIWRPSEKSMEQGIKSAMFLLSVCSVIANQKSQNVRTL